MRGRFQCSNIAQLGKQGSDADTVCSRSFYFQATRNEGFGVNEFLVLNLLFHFSVVEPFVFSII